MKSTTADPRSLRSAALALALAAVLAACGSDSEASERAEDGSPAEVVEAPTDASEAPAQVEEPPEASPAPINRQAERSADEGAARNQPVRAESPPPPPPPPARLIPEGSVLVFEVLEEVSTDSHEEGDTFRLRLVEGVAGTGGASLAGAEQARAEVVEARRSASSEEPAVLDVRLESIVVAGSRLPLAGILESAELETGTQASGRRTAATIAGGTAAGALIGQVFGGNTRSTVAGAAVGAIAGTGVALANRDGHAVIPEGSLLSMRLTEPLEVP